MTVSGCAEKMLGVRSCVLIVVLIVMGSGIGMVFGRENVRRERICVTCMILRGWGILIGKEIWSVDGELVVRMMMMTLMVVTVVVALLMI